MWLRTPGHFYLERQCRDREQAKAKLLKEAELKTARQREKRADYDGQEKERIEERRGQGAHQRAMRRRGTLRSDEEKKHIRKW